MDLTNMEGVEGDYDLRTELAAAVIDGWHEGNQNWFSAGGMEKLRADFSVQAVMNVLRQRGYLTPEAIEQLKKEGL